MATRSIEEMDRALREVERKVARLLKGREDEIGDKREPIKYTYHVDPDTGAVNKVKFDDATSAFVGEKVR